jgi:hypothetical protein
MARTAADILSEVNKHSREIAVTTLGDHLELLTRETRRATALEVIAELERIHPEIPYRVVEALRKAYF